MPTPDVSEAKVWAALQAVKDPEIPVVSVVEMGIVRGVAVSEEGVRVTMTPTFSGCPALHVIREDIGAAVAALGVPARVETVLSPPWTTDWITEAGREKLARYGVAPPEPTGELDDLIVLEPPPTPCPRCGSLDTGVKNTFGPTLCKRIHVCNACREPFEAFKVV
jgi:ring-1,2-phenylacetyl-CoA epoxidase subunit PaaD